MTIHESSLAILITTLAACGGRTAGIDDAHDVAPDASASLDAAADALARSPDAARADAGADEDPHCVESPDHRISCSNIPASGEIDASPSTPFTVDGIDGGGIDGGTCIEVALATYDRSCASDSDCVSISSGVVCTFGCVGACPNAAINKVGLTRYNESLARLGHTEPCECGNDLVPDAFCRNGLCFRRSSP